MFARFGTVGSVPAGRPSDYTPELAAAICHRLAGGETLREICREDGMPDKVTVLRWLAKHEEFRTQYASAREIQQDCWADEIVEISDDGSNDWIERQTKSGETETVLDHEHINRSRLRVDTRKWIMARAAPKKYGDRVAMEHSGPEGGALHIRWESGERE